MPVIARDSIASDHLVYAWPFPIGPDEYEVACAEDEQVVMCPAWTVAGLLGPGRHRWRTPNPMSPVSAYFVLTAPVEVSYDMTTSFVLPTTGQTVRLRGNGSLQVRCSDASLLIAQFVGLPFDVINDGILRSVSRSVERMLARLLTRRVVAANTPAAVTDPAMLANIIEELVAYNPAAGAVFGVELVRMGHLAITADDGSQSWQALERSSGNHPRPNGPNGPNGSGSNAMTETARGRAKATTPPPVIPVIVEPPPMPVAIPTSNPPAAPAPSSTMKRSGSQPSSEMSGEINIRPRGEASGEINLRTASGEINTRAKAEASGEINPREKAEASGEINARPKVPSKPPTSVTQPLPTLPLVSKPPPPPPESPAIGSSPGTTKRRTTGPAVEVPQSTDEITQPGVQIVRTPIPGSMRIGVSEAGDESRGAILGIGVGHIGQMSSAAAAVASGEIVNKIAPGARVLVPGPNGLMQSATVRQLLQGYYELEVGGSGETIWVPINGVVPE